MNGDKIGQVKLRKFSGIKLLKKQSKVNKKVSGHTYVRIRNQKTKTCNQRDYSEIKGNRVKCAFTSEIRIFYYHRPAELQSKKEVRIYLAKYVYSKKTKVNDRNAKNRNRL